MTKEEARARLKKQIKAEYGTEKSFAVAMGWQRQKVSYLVKGTRGTRFLRRLRHGQKQKRRWAP
jgi:hypothetical protein